MGFVWFRATLLFRSRFRMEKLYRGGRTAIVLSLNFASFPAKMPELLYA